MGFMEFTRGELHAALAALGVASAASVRRYGSGHINDTFKVDTPDGREYILQRVNTAIFADLAPLEENIRRVTSHLAAKGAKTLEVVAYEGPWRLYGFLSGYESRDVADSPETVYGAAFAYAKFARDLSDLPAPRLHEILPRFHDTADRLRLLDAAAGADVAGRRKDAADCLAFVDARREEAVKIRALAASGALPERTVHNDTKLNNVLVAPDGGAVVIDLDTVMPGTILSDFGDMVRSATATAAEDEPDLSKVGSRPDFFEAIASGYLDGADLAEAEVENLTLAGRVSTFEVGVRFLTDYLSGDHYFNTAYPGHNLVRARNQFRMVESLEAREAEYSSIVRRLSRRGAGASNAGER